ncbi:MAG: Ferric enterobactin receptor precursor [Pseudomonadota bacterium]|jgi:outer membrane receptor protein involved in Fe transport
MEKPVKNHRPKVTRSALSVAAALAAMQLGAVWAQSAPAVATDKSGTLNLEEVVVTGTATRNTKMKQSVSVSTVAVEQIQQNQPTNAADILRSVPGLRAESSGGAGNANVTVRGLPISAGGSRYVQFQEDGLPVLLFGDIAFATPDMFVRADGAIDRLEVIRGGSASTLGTNSPGGIVNFITKTGEDKGGNIGVTTGVGFNELRYDFDYGGRLGEKTRFFVGGYFNQGQGPRNAAPNAISGGQIRGNVTQELDNGYVRLNFKRIQEQSPLFMPVPVTISNGSIGTVPGIDPRKATGYSPYWVPDRTLTKNNTFTNSDVNSGLTVNSSAIGLDASLRLANDWQLTEKFKYSTNSGRFIGIFPATDVAAVGAGTTYATGPNKGKAYTGLAYTAAVFNTSLDDLGSTTNDLRLSKTFSQASGAKITTTAGLFTNLQRVGLTWNFNQYLLQATDNNPALLANAATAAYGTTPGALALNSDVWGGCCTRAIDATYRTTSPYGALTFEQGPWTVDGSIRLDNQVATGSYNQAVANVFTAAGNQNINYKLNRTSYSVGANYQFSKDLAAFARVSDGVAFNADRIMFGSANLSGGVIPINQVTQLEGGVKMRQGNLSTFVTLFQAKTTESNYDATTQKSTANKYDAKGIELEAGYRAGGFRIGGGATYTNARITDSLSTNLVGTAPNRQAKLIYQISPSYTTGDLTVGANILATTKSKDAQGTPLEATLPGYTVVNMFASYAVALNTTASVGVYNLMNTIGYTESNDGRAAARSINGRTVRATLKYAF